MKLILKGDMTHGTWKVSDGTIVYGPYHVVFKEDGTYVMEPVAVAEPPVDPVDPPDPERPWPTGWEDLGPVRDIEGRPVNGMDPWVGSEDIEGGDDVCLLRTHGDGSRNGPKGFAGIYRAFSEGPERAFVIERNPVLFATPPTDWEGNQSKEGVGNETVTMVQKPDGTWVGLVGEYVYRDGRHARRDYVLTFDAETLGSDYVKREHPLTTASCLPWAQKWETIDGVVEGHPCKEMSLQLLDGTGMVMAFSARGMWDGKGANRTGLMYSDNDGESFYVDADNMDPVLPDGFDHPALMRVPGQSSPLGYDGGWWLFTAKGGDLHVHHSWDLVEWVYGGVVWEKGEADAVGGPAPLVWDGVLYLYYHSQGDPDFDGRNGIRLLKGQLP